MTINHPHDILKLLDERVEVMEDLNVEELRDCVRSFIFAAWYLDMLKTAIERAKYGKDYNRDEIARMQFESMKETTESYVNRIDELTLRADAAE